MDGPRRPRRASGAFAHQAAASVAACSLAFLHSAAASMEISVLVPTRITAGPHPCRLILKNMSSEMRCAVQNSRIDIASGGPRIGGASPLACAVACGFLPVTSGRAIAITPLKPDGAMHTAKPNFWHGWDAVRRDEMRRDATNQKKVRRCWTCCANGDRAELFTRTQVAEKWALPRLKFFWRAQVA